MERATDDQIIEMLKAGASYSDIQAELRVSPSRIILVKKIWQKSLSSTNDALLAPTTTIITPEEKKEEATTILVEEVVVKEEKEEDKTEGINTTPLPKTTTRKKPKGKTLPKAKTTPTPDPIRQQLTEHFKHIHPTLHPTTSPLGCVDCDKRIKKGMNILPVKLKGGVVFFCSVKCLKKWQKQYANVHPELNKIRTK